MIEIKEDWNYRPFFDENAYIQVVFEKEDLHYSECREWIIIGYPGVNGMDFRIIANSSASNVFAFYPYESRTVEVALNIADLILKWQENKITL